MKLSFIIEAIDRATAPVRAVTQRLDTLTEPVRRVRASVSALAQEAGLMKLADQAKAIGKSFDGVTASLRSVAAAGVVAAGLGAAVFLPMKGVIDQASKINDTAAMLGVSSRDFQRLAYALTLDGSSAEDAATSLRFLQKNAVDALTGNKELSIWFRRAGMDADFLKKNLNNPIALINRLSDAMAKNIAPAQRIALMQALLGRGGARNAQTLARGSAELRRLGDEAERLGAVMDEKTVGAMDDAGDSLTRMERALGGVLNRVVAAALPAVEKISASVIEWAVANRELIASRVTEFVERLIQNLPQIVDTTTRIVGAVGTAIVVADRIAQALGGWDVVATAIAATLGGKLALSVLAFGRAVLGLLPVLIKLGVVLLTTPVGWFLAAVAAIAAAAYLIYKNWEPIKQFFVDLWEGVKAAILQLDAVTPDWIKKYTLPGAALSLAANAVRPAAPAASPIGGAAAAGQTDVGGVISIKIDQDGRARVASMQTNNRNVDFDVDSGPIFAGA